jgi:hypothetical protein
MNIYGQMKWWYVYDLTGKLVHSCRCHTETGAIADAASVTGRSFLELTAKTTYTPSKQ